MDFMNELVSKFQFQMTSYDQHLVDKSVEQRILQGLQNVPRKATKFSNDHLDIDLIRGTPFKKAKLSSNWATFLRKGICRSIFMPYYFAWWRQHTSSRFAVAVLIIYIMILFHIALYYSIADSNQIFTSEVVLPAAVGILLSILFTRITSLHSSRKLTTAKQASSSQSTAKRARKRNKQRHPKTELTDQSRLPANSKVGATSSSLAAADNLTESYNPVLGWNISTARLPTMDAKIEAERKIVDATESNLAGASVMSNKAQSAAEVEKRHISGEGSDPGIEKAHSCKAFVRDDEAPVSTFIRVDAGRHPIASTSVGRPSSLKQSIAGRSTHSTLANATSRSKERTSTVSFGTLPKSKQKPAITGSGDLTSDPDADVDVDHHDMRLRRFLSAKVKNIPDPTPLSCCEDTLDGEGDGDSMSGEHESSVGQSKNAESDTVGDGCVGSWEAMVRLESGPVSSHKVQSSEHIDKRRSSLVQNDLKGEVEEDEGDEDIACEVDEYGEAEYEESDDELVFETRADDPAALRIGVDARLSFSAVDAEDAVGGSLTDDVFAVSALARVPLSTSGKPQLTALSQVHSPTVLRRHTYVLQRERSYHLNHARTKRKQKRVFQSHLASTVQNGSAPLTGTISISCTSDIKLDEQERPAGGEFAGGTESGERKQTSLVGEALNVPGVNDIINADGSTETQVFASKAKNNGTSSDNNDLIITGGLPSPAMQNADANDEDERCSTQDINAHALRDDSSEYDTIVMNSRRRADFAALFRERAVHKGLVQTTSNVTVSDCTVLERSRSPSAQRVLPDCTVVDSNPLAVPLRTGSTTVQRRRTASTGSENGADALSTRLDIARNVTTSANGGSFAKQKAECACTKELVAPVKCPCNLPLRMPPLIDGSTESDVDCLKATKASLNCPVHAGKLDTSTSVRRDAQSSSRSPTHKGARSTSRSTAVGTTSINASNSQPIASSSGKTPKRTASRSQERVDGQASETEWDRLNSDVNVSTDTSSSEEESTDGVNTATFNAAEQEDPFLLWYRESKQGGKLHPSAHTAASDKLSCYIWEAQGDGDCKKLDLTLIDVGWSIIQRVEKQRDSHTFLKCAVGASLVVAAAPILFRAYKQRASLTALAPLDAPFTSLGVILHALLTDSVRAQAVVALGVLLRFVLMVLHFLFLVTAERAFYKRLLYAKHFSYITSARRARKYELPHFRLNKVKNIRVWLSLRSYLRKRGPLRSVDMIVSDGFLIEVFLIGVMCYSLVQLGDNFMEDLVNWDATLAAAGIGIFLLRFMTVGLQIDKKFRNLSILITEQMNLYLHMEQKPHKKEELMMANNVLRLAEELLKQLERPFTISGMALNPFLYNITKIVLLSAFSGALTEMLGFKLKLYKIKIGSAFS